VRYLFLGAVLSFPAAMRAASAQPDLICVKDRAGFLAAMRAVMVGHYLTVSVTGTVSLMKCDTDTSRPGMTN
jgi:hypothetical protein